MVENGNKPKGMILIIILLVAILTILVQVILLSSGKQLAAFGYSDPVVSHTQVRGTIYDRNGSILAIQAPEYGFSFKKVINNHQAIASDIAPFTNYTSLEVATMLDGGLEFLPVKGIPTKSDAEIYTRFLESMGYADRVSFGIREVRKYPTKHCQRILGTAIKSYKAEGGIEALFNEDLKAEPQEDTISVYGKSLVLTLDLNMQIVLEDTMSFLGKEGTIIIMNTNDEIVAAYGHLDEEILSSLVYSISSDTETIRHEAKVPAEILQKALIVEEYKVFIDAQEKETIIRGLLNAYSSSGKI